MKRLTSKDIVANSEMDTAENRVINAAYQAMKAQVEQEQLKDPAMMLAELETARVIALTTMLYTFQTDKNIMQDVADKWCDELKRTLLETYDFAFTNQGTVH